MPVFAPLLRAVQPVVLVMSCCAGLAFAQAHSIKPGLWEVTHQAAGGNAKMDEAMKRMEQQVANMPPEQRKKMEEMMARRGVGLAGFAPGGGSVFKVCISKEMAARRQMPMQQRGDCTQNVTSQSASGMHMQFSCKTPPIQGEGDFTFSGDSAYQMTMTTTAQIHGKAETTSMNASGKWLSADCGTLKPMPDALAR